MPFLQYKLPYEIMPIEKVWIAKFNVGYLHNKLTDTYGVSLNER